MDDLDNDVTAEMSHGPFEKAHPFRHLTGKHTSRLHDRQQQMAAEPAGRIYCGLICHNVSKRHNIGTLVRSATAFGVTEVRLPVHGLPAIVCPAPNVAIFDALH